MKKNISYIVVEEEIGLSLKEYLLSKDIPRQTLRKFRDSNRVLVDGEIREFWKPLLIGEEVSIDPYSKKTSNVKPISREFKILYEDYDYIVVDKPYDIYTHPTKDILKDTMANFVMSYLLEKNISTIHPINRLDKITSGVLIFGKHSLAQNNIVKQQVKKEYIALVEGNFKEESLTIDYPIKKFDGPSIRRVVAIDGKEAITKVSVISRGDDYSLLRIAILTGRTHQIRVHLAHIGYPVVGDFLYGKENAPRLFLHSHKYTFTTLREKKEIEVNSPIPQIFYDYL